MTLKIAWKNLKKQYPIESHQHKMETHLNALKSFENCFDSNIKQAKTYPDWAVGFL